MIAVVSERQLAEVLQRAREYRQLSRDDLARRVHADRRTVAGRETGGQGYTLAALIETAQALGYTLALIPDEAFHQARAA